MNNTILELWRESKSMPKAYVNRWRKLSESQDNPESSKACESALLACIADSEFSAALCDPNVKNKNLASAAAHKRFTFNNAEKLMEALK